MNPTKQHLTPKFSLLLLLIFAFNNLGVAKNNEAIITSKANFILEVAYNIYYNEPSNTKTFDIGVYGRDSEAKAVFSKLSHMTQGLTIDDKPIHIKLFKSMRSVIPIDVIYISGHTKIRLGDLHNKLSDNSYSMITENYPFGSSSINFSLDKDNELIFEVQEATLRSNGATIRRKLLKNRQRIASAKKWQSAIGGNDSWSIPVAKDTEIEVPKPDSTGTGITQEEKSETKHLPAVDCTQEVQKANSRTKWVTILSLLIIGGLGYYIYKLKRNIS